MTVASPLRPVPTLPFVQTVAYRVERSASTAHTDRNEVVQVAAVRTPSTATVVVALSDEG